MTRQQAFDRIWQAYVIEGRPPGYQLCTGGGWHCQLHGREGGQCALGLFIPPEQYAPHLEVLGVSDLLAAPRVEGLFALEDTPEDLWPEFWNTLRYLHDSTLGQKSGIEAALDRPRLDLWSQRVEVALREFAATWVLTLPEERPERWDLGQLAREAPEMAPAAPPRVGAL